MNTFHFLAYAVIKEFENFEQREAPISFNHLIAIEIRRFVDVQTFQPWN